MFITTPEQDYLLSILKTTKVMRRSQTLTLLQKLDHGKTEQFVARCLEQLRHIRKIVWLTDDLFTLPLLQKSPVDESMLSAIDIMLDLTEVRVDALSASAQPYKLCFLAQQQNDIGNYAIIVAPPGSEAVITASLRSSDDDGRTVIFLVSTLSQAEGIKTSLPHFFAISDGGKYRYYSGGG